MPTKEKTRSVTITHEDAKAMTEAFAQNPIRKIRKLQERIVKQNIRDLSVQNEETKAFSRTKVLKLHEKIVEAGVEDLALAALQASVPAKSIGAKRSPQEIFTRINEIKEQIGEKRRQLKAIWMENPDYLRVDDEMLKLRDRRKKIVADINQAHPTLCETIDVLKTDLKSEKEIFSDLILCKIAAGERVELKDKFEQPCFPMFSVTMTPIK